MSLALTIVASYDPQYLRIAEHMVRRDRSNGHSPVVLDITSISPVPSESYHRKTLHFFGFQHPGHDLPSRLRDVGSDYMDIRSVLARAPEASLSALDEEQLAIAVESALITYFRTDQPRRRIRRIGHLAEALDRQGRSVYRAVKHVLGEQEFAVMNVPNGRFPSQKMAIIAAVDSGVPTVHYEKGETPSGAYIQPYAPQNRLASQGAVDGVLATLSQGRIEEIAQKWLDRRAPAAASANTYSANWTDELPEALKDVKPGQPVIGFFTSSQDEFQFLGKEWHLHEWKSQFEAFDTILNFFEEQGALCYLRIHPNLATKAEDCFRREREDLERLASRHPQLVVIPHDDPVSSYALVAASQGVVVWYSTLGLEASARSVPVWTCAVARYGEVADVREVFGESDVTKSMMTPWPVDSQGAKRYISYLVSRDEEIDMSLPAWEPWAANKKSWRLAIARLFVSGGNPSVRDALQATVDTWRHRSARFNRASLKAKRASSRSKA